MPCNGTLIEGRRGMEGAEWKTCFLIGIVGPCSSGKSAVRRRLEALGYQVKEIRQEHSVMPSMWLKLTHPDVLIYLDVDMEVAAQREGLTAIPSWWVEEREFRLAHARAHCDLYVDTTLLAVEDVIERVVAFLETRAHPTSSVNRRDTPDSDA